MRVVFAGTPAPALPSLQALIDSSHDVVAVITRADAPVGRGRQLSPSPIAELAAANGIEVHKPTSLKDPEFLDTLRALRPDACPVVAFGMLVPPTALEIPRHGWINLHFSLLPAWRGAAPVQHAIWHGDDVTGASTFKLESGLDTGPVYGLVTTAIKPADTAGDVLAELADSGSQLLLGTLDGIESGELVAVPQPGDGVSLAPKITVAMGEVNWELPAIAVDRMIRACTPAPGAWSTWRGERIKLGPVTVGLPDLPRLEAGEIRVTKHVIEVGTTSQPVVLSSVKAPGKRDVPAGDWARGARIEPGERFR